METKKFEDLSKGDQIKAMIYARPNYITGRYQTAQIFGLDNLSEINSNDIFFLETLKIRADSADKIFADANSQGTNVDDTKIMKELGEQINALGEPIHRSYAIGSAIGRSFELVVSYAIVGGIWGLVFKKSFFVFSLFGGIAGLLVSVLFVAPIVASQRTKHRMQDIIFGAGSLLFVPVIYIGVLGLIVWIIRLIFF